jgi:hypothetical protein
LPKARGWVRIANQYKVMVWRTHLDNMRWHKKWPTRPHEERLSLERQGMSERFRSKESVIRNDQGHLRVNPDGPMPRIIGQWIALQTKYEKLVDRYTVVPGLPLTPDEYELGTQWYRDHLDAAPEVRFPKGTKHGTSRSEYSAQLTKEEQKKARVERAEKAAAEPKIAPLAKPPSLVPGGGVWGAEGTQGRAAGQGARDRSRSNVPKAVSPNVQMGAAGTLQQRAVGDLQGPTPVAWPIPPEWPGPPGEAKAKAEDKAKAKADPQSQSSGSQWWQEGYPGGRGSWSPGPGGGGWQAWNWRP